MYALADCNNFFVSCERVFRPDLEGKPVIVLSNNDGCAIARSNEAKALGIRMGAPYFKIRDIVERNNVAVFSGNHALYGDMSRRIRMTLAEFAPHVEVYSIDEAFLDLRGMENKDFDALAKSISARCKRNTGIPVSVGIAPTRTLAKIASKLCKQYPKLQGGCYMHRKEDIEKVLRKFPINYVWGVGRKMFAKLQDRGINTAYDYTQMPHYLVQKLFGITGLRTWRELRGESCIEIAATTDTRQSISNTRSFSHEITRCEELAEQVANFAAMTAEKLRSQRTICEELHIFAVTNRFRDDLPQSYASTIVHFSEPTNSSRQIISAAVAAAREIFVEGYSYKKAGVTAIKILPQEGYEYNLFSDNKYRQKELSLTKALDDITAKAGYNSIRFGVQGSGKIRMANEHRSPCYTTQWSDIPTATIK